MVRKILNPSKLTLVFEKIISNLHIKYICKRVNFKAYTNCTNSSEGYPWRDAQHEQKKPSHVQVGHVQ